MGCERAGAVGRARSVRFEGDGACQSHPRPRAPRGSVRACGCFGEAGLGASGENSWSSFKAGAGAWHDGFVGRAGKTARLRRATRSSFLPAPMKLRNYLTLACVIGGLTLGLASASANCGSCEGDKAGQSCPADCQKPCCKDKEKAAHPADCSCDSCKEKTKAAHPADCTCAGCKEKTKGS